MGRRELGGGLRLGSVERLRCALAWVCAVLLGALGCEALTPPTPGSLSVSLAWEEVPEEPVWIWARPEQRPAVRARWSAAEAGFTHDEVKSLRVRARCGADAPSPGPFDPPSDPLPGAELQMWQHEGEAGWETLGTTSADADSADTATTPSAALDWQSASPGEAGRFLRDPTLTAALRCRPAAGSGSALPRPAVALDYVELRIRVGGD